MKLVHSNINKQELDINQPVAVLMQLGKQLEREAPDRAVELYNKMIRLYPHKIILYDRLLIVLRKEKSIKKELQVLTSAISHFQKIHDLAYNRKASKKITHLSNAILKMTGMHTRGKNLDVHLPQPLLKWTKRKNSILKKQK